MSNLRYDSKLPVGWTVSVLASSDELVRFAMLFDTFALNTHTCAMIFTDIGMGLMAFQQLVGINSLIYYSPTLFATLGFDLDLTLTMGGVMNVIQLLAVCVPLFAIDKIGRRPWLIGGSVGMTISHVVVAIMIGEFTTDSGEID